MKKSVVIIGVVVVALAAVVVLPKVMRPKAVMEEAVLPVVQVETPASADIELYRNVVGKVEPSDVAYIYPKTAGEVLEVFVKAGDMVEEGQVLCKIDTKQVDAARLTMESAQVALENAQTNLTRQQALFAAGDISPAAFEQAQTAAKSAQIQYETAKLNYDNQVEFSNITAPISGKVEACSIEVHDLVSAQNLISVISGEGSRAVTFSVTEKVVKELHAGDEVKIEKGGMEYSGTITEVSSMIDAATGLFAVKASVENGDALATGSTVSLQVMSDKAEQVMSIPVDSVYYSGGEAYVYTYDQGVVHQVPVEVGIYDSERAEIRSGLSASDQVITTWSSELFEGSEVTAASGESDAAAETVETAETTETEAE